MLTQNFVCGITFHALCARIPICDNPAGIEHVDCVVNDAFHEDSESALAFDDVPLRLNAFGDITRDFRKTDQRPPLVENRLRDCVGAEASSILPDTPALGFIPAGGSGGLQDLLGKTISAIFRDKEAGKVLPDDLDVSIARNALRTDIPGCDESVRVEHENGVIGNGVEQELDSTSIHWVPLGGRYLHIMPPPLCYLPDGNVRPILVAKRPRLFYNNGWP